MNQVPNYFLPLLNKDMTPEQFMDVIGFCLYKGLKLNFSANGKQGYYFGYFSSDEDSFVDCDSFKFFDLNNYLFKEQKFLNNYILNKKIIVSLYYETKLKCYILQLKKIKYNRFSNTYKYQIKQEVKSNNIKDTLIKMNKRLINIKKQQTKNDKILYLDRFRQYG